MDSVTRGSGERLSVPGEGLTAAVRPAALRTRAFAFLAGPILVCLLCWGFCWKLTLSPDYTWIDDPDVVHMDVPRLQFQRATWHNHEFPLWDPHLWGGQPFLGEIVGAAFPLNWPFFFFPRGPVGLLSLGTLNWYFVFLHLVGALAAYWLCRELQASVLASALGGFVYSFGGFVGVTLWPEVLSSMVVAPLIFVFLARALRGDRPFGSAALSGMFLGVAWLSGHHEIPIYLSFTVAAIWIYEFLARPGARRRNLLLTALSLACAVLTSGFQTLPGYEYAQLAVRWVGIDHPIGWKEGIPYRVDAQYSLLPSSLVSLVIPWAVPMAGAFNGVVALALAAIAVLSAWRERFVRLFLVIGLAGLLLAFGSSNDIHGLFYAILPAFGKTRNPVRLLSIFQIGVAVLAALGADALAGRATAGLLRRTGRTLAVLAGGIFAVGLTMAMLQKPGLTDPSYMAAFIAFLLACLLLAYQKGSVSRRALRVGVLVLVFIELGNGSAGLFYDRTPGPRKTWLPNLSQYDDIAAFLRTQPGPVRVQANDVTGAFNFGDWEGIDTLTGYGAGLTANLFSLDWASVPTQNLLGVGYTVSQSNTPRADQDLVFHSKAGVNVFRNRDAFPRAWIVHRLEGATGAKQLQSRLKDPGFDARHTALLQGRAPQLESCDSSDEAHISARSANTVTIEARLGCRGMLILSDTWYPGWSATAEGQPLSLYEPDGALRGVVLPAGTHRVEFRYRPASALIGGVMSISGVLLACGLALWENRRSRRIR